MEAKYMQAIKAGVIGGVILAVGMLINLFISIITSNLSAFTGLGLVSCCIFLLEIVVLIGTGALAVKMAGPLVTKLGDAIAIGAVSGAVAGLIGTVVQVVDAVVRPSLTSVPSYIDYYGTDYGVGTSVLSSLGAMGATICCCGPALIIIGAVLAAIGAAIYAVAVVKIK